MKLSPTSHGSSAVTTRAVGELAERQALAHLRQQGLDLIVRNYRTPGRGGGEIDLIMRTPDGTVVFVEVRHRRQSRQGGAAASVGRVKRRRIAWAARHFLMRCRQPPACRFDVVAIEGETLHWFPGAFEVQGGLSNALGV